MKSYLLCLITTVVAVAGMAGSRAASMPPIAGVLGPYDNCERQAFLDKVVSERANLYGDDLPLNPTDRDLRRARQMASRLGTGSLAHYYAVYYVFPEDGSPFTLYGILMPASEEVAQVHLASMHVGVEEKDMVRLGSLPRTTVVYGVDGSGNRAWFPLEYFSLDKDYPGYMSAEGLYAYTYRPSAKLLGRYGNAAFYLNILDRSVLCDAAVIPLENVTLEADSLPDDFVKVAYYSRPAFLAGIIPLLDNEPQLGSVPFEIALNLRGSQRLSMDVRLPAPFLWFDGTEQQVFPAHGIKDALDLFRSHLYSEISLLGEPRWQALIRDCELSVTHYNRAGELKFTKAVLPEGAFGWKVDVRGVESEEFHALAGETLSRDNYLGFGFSVAENMDIIPLISAVTGANGATGTLPGTDRLSARVEVGSRYDTRLHGIEKLRLKTIPAVEMSPIVGPDRYFLLDEFPGFYGAGTDGFSAWLLEQIEFPEGLYGKAVFEFVVGSDGKMYDLDIVEVSDWLLLQKIADVMAAGLQWVPGEISGFPVNVLLRAEIEFRP